MLKFECVPVDAVPEASFYAFSAYIRVQVEVEDIPPALFPIIIQPAHESKEAADIETRPAVTAAHV